jgi:DNA polymerase III epsilon subunit-like protein
LVGGDLSDIDPDWFASKTSDNPKDQLPAIKKELAQIIATLMRKKHVIVGHNLLMDLGFIYKTFIGVLPAKVGHFQQMVHEHFPVVIDTKYLATHNTDAMNPRANLKDLLEPFKKVHVPLIVLHEEHTAYGAAYGKEHEAGFDSWMTAELFVKLSAKLYSTYEPSISSGDDDFDGNSSSGGESTALHYSGGLNLPSDDESDSSTGGGATLKPRSASPKKIQNINTRRVGLHNNGSQSTLVKKQLTTTKSYLGGGTSGKKQSNTMDTSLGGSALVDPKAPTAAMSSMSAMTAKPANSLTARPSFAIPIKSLNTEVPVKAPPPVPALVPKYMPPQHLLDTDLGSMAMQDILPPSYHATELNPKAAIIHDTDEEAAVAATEPKVQQWIPDMGDRFWGVYINKLRANAVQGGVCDLASPVIAEEGEEDDGEDY